MTAHVFPFRAKRADTRALQIVRANTVASLVASKSEKKLGSRALRALGRTVECFVALCYGGMLLTIIALSFGICGIGLAIGYETGKAIYRWIVG